MYNVLNNQEVYDHYRVNATYFQVACGIYGSICTLILDNLPIGIYYVDELLLSTKSNYGKYVTYYLTDFVSGENKEMDGDLLNRMREVKRDNSA